MATKLELALHELSDIQREVVRWGEGSLLVLAGPGSGKTRVLTSRAARLLDRSPDERFRILALTFTNKAAHEMSSRLADLAPGLEERADIHTFHNFCAQVLRQHGIHVGIKPDFAIFGQDSDREAVLGDALNRSPELYGQQKHRFLPSIDAMKSRLIDPEQAESWICERNGNSPDDAKPLAHAYHLYEKELRHANALDFNSLILEAFRLFAFPAIARHYQTVYRYWLVDEFQDTSQAQYKLLRRMAGATFRQVFAVADDDQVIYEWNGASVRRINALIEDFDCDVVQLPTNFRCPPRVVEIANRLVVYNVRRAIGKRPAEPARERALGGKDPIGLRVFETDEEEVAGIAAEIAALGSGERGRTLVLARTRAPLEKLAQALQANAVPAEILSRRDDFASPQMRWLIACIKQINRPLDERNLITLAKAFSDFAPASTGSPNGGASALDIEDLLLRSTTEGNTYLSVWISAAKESLPEQAKEPVDLVAKLAAGELRLEPAIDQIIDRLKAHPSDSNFKDDLSALHRLRSEIRTAIGSAPLDRFLQELELRSKEPVPSPDSVSLATIHAAKGLEFDRVYLLGLAEEVLPSWHSLKKGEGSWALEEERRSCFVAITRTKEHLVLSRAREYRGWAKQPSRFLAEMGITDRGTGTLAAMPG